MDSQMLGGTTGVAAPEDASVPWRRVADRMPDSLSVCEVIRDTAGRITDYRHIFVNPVWSQATGIKAGSVLGVPSREAFPGLEESWREDFARVVEEQVQMVLERYTAVTDATYRAKVFPVDGDRFAVLATDVSDHVRTEARLRDRNSRMERRVAGTVGEAARTWDVTPDLLTVLHPDGRFEQVNPAWNAALGYEPDDMVGVSFVEFIHPDDVEASLAAKETVNAGDPVLGFENRYRHVDGGYRWLSWVAVPEGERIYASARDVTEDKARARALGKAEEALRQSQKMEVIGQLTGGIAHDFNNLLMAVQSSVNLAKRRIRDGRPEEAQGMLDNALEGVERGAGLTQHMLAFARKQDLDPGRVDVPALVDDAEGLVQRAVGPEVRIATEFADDVPPALVDATQLEMALLNLAINAKDAMDGRGTLSIRVDTVGEPGGGDLPAGRYVRLHVQDEGSGMDADTLQKAVEPFFTTKATGQGTGLGLSMVQGLAEQSGGTFRMRSEVGVGTVAEILLPVHEPGAAGEREAPADTDTTAKPGRQRPLHVLAVDDDFLVLLGTEGVLEDMGHSVTSAESGAEALEFLAAGGETVDVILTDQAMPGMTGAEFGRIAQGLYPDIPLVLATGYSEIEGDAAGLFAAVLGKPFTEGDLERVLGEVT